MMKCNRQWHRTASRDVFGVFLFFYFSNLQHRQDTLFDKLHAGMAGAKGHEAKQYNNVLTAHGWAPDSDPKKREWAGESRKKLQAEELCEKVSICSMLDTAQNKQVKIKPQKDSQSLRLKFLQTEDYRVTISKVWEIVSFAVYPTATQPIMSGTATPPAEAQLVAA